MPQFDQEVTFTIFGVPLRILAAVRKQRAIRFGHLLDVENSNQMLLFEYPSIKAWMLYPKGLSSSNWS